jgi:triphosphoribosyl-dephospho-CoA synthase
MVVGVPEKSGNGPATLASAAERGQAGRRRSPARAAVATVRSTDSVAGAAQLACVLEVSAEKPGNITPSHDFHDTSYEDMLRSAIAVGPELARAGDRGVGETVLAVVQASRSVAPANTNLGIALLLAPLAKAALSLEPPILAAPRHRGSPPDADRPRSKGPHPEDARPIDPGGAHGAEASTMIGGSRLDGEPLRARLGATLRALDLADARAAYEAIRLAAAGGLGERVEHDVRSEPAIGLLDAMASAAGRDSIASEYVTDYALTFQTGIPALVAALADGLAVREAIVELALRLLDVAPDTLIARKRGTASAARVSAGARDVLAAGGVRTAAGRRALRSFDASLREPGNALNPGTTADLVTATVFVGVLEGML